MLEILISILIGYLLGLISGLMPGIHTNNFALLLVSAFPILMEHGFSPFCIAIMIISNSITHTFLDIIPSVFLGAPEADTALAVLPGHQLVLEGKGIEAIKLSALGSVGAIIFSFVLILPLSILFSKYSIIETHIVWILIFIVIIMILSEKGERIEWRGRLASLKFKGYAVLVFLLSGFLGMLSFERESLLQPLIGFSPSILFPLFTGIFGASMLIVSLLTGTEIPEQEEKGEVSLQKPRLLRGILTGSLAGSVVSFLPGVSPAIGTLLARLCIRERGKESGKEYIVSVSGVNTANAIFCLISLYVIGKTRSGAMDAVNRIFERSLWDENVLIVFLVSILFVSILSYFSTISIGKRASILLPRLNYKIFSASILILIVAMVIVLAGLFGLIVFLCAIPIGLIPTFAGIRRTHAMGVLLLPLILRFL